MYDICAIGDILVDFTPMGLSSAGNYIYECNAGGTAANMAAAAGKMGLNTLFIGKVGNDDMGEVLKNALKKSCVDVSGCCIDDNRFSTLSFVTLIDGERSFSFFRQNAADTNLSLEDVQMEKALNSKILYFSGMCLTDQPIRDTTFFVVKEARNKGILITLDVNYRERLWSSEEEATEIIRSAISFVDIYKSSEEEALFITNEKTIEKAAEKILEWGPKLIIITRGPEGAFYRYSDFTGHLHTFDTKPIDTTGAGDCFMAAVLYQVVKRGGIEDLSQEEIENIINFANAAGAHSITKRGGVSSMPTIEEIETCMKTISKLVI